jgi:glycosyltransferase involved in cell wall biosynthesis
VRVLLFTQYFFPEVTAARARLHSLAVGLAERGHEVQVVCEVPNHPEGRVLPEFRGRAVTRRLVDGLNVVYVWVRASPARTTRARIASYGSYSAMAFVVGSVLSRPDVVLASSPPLTVGPTGAAVARRFGVPWLMDVRDVWPEVAVALGELSDGPMLRFAAWLERRLYSSANAITTPTEPFRESIAAKAPPTTDVVVMPNGTTSMWLEMGESVVDRIALGMNSDRFVWTYAGNLGLAQSLENAIEAARLLGNEYQFLVIGGGPVRERLEAMAATLPPGRVVFKAPMPPRECARWMRASDAILVPLADDPALTKPVPSKLYDSCAIGRPVIVAAPGETRRLAQTTGAALAVTPDDPEALAASVRRLRADSALRDGLQSAGRAFAEKHLRQAQVPVLENLLGQLR